MSGVHGEPGDGAADAAASDETDGGHAPPNRPGDRVIPVRTREPDLAPRPGTGTRCRGAAPWHGLKWAPPPRPGFTAFVTRTPASLWSRLVDGGSGRQE